MYPVLTKLLVSSVVKTLGKRLLVLALRELAKRKDNDLIDEIVDAVADTLGVPAEKSKLPSGEK